MGFSMEPVPASDKQMQGFNTGMLLLLRAEGQVNSRTIAFALQLADIETCTAECRHTLKSEYGCIVHISHKVQGLSFTFLFPFLF